MTTAEIVSLIKDVGVPVAMLVWFAWRVERKLDALQEGQIEATKAMTRVASALEQVDDRLEITGQHKIVDPHGRVPMPSSPGMEKPP